jgi:hypothetical protein
VQGCSPTALSTFVPTPVEVMDCVFSLAKLANGDAFYDFGCGDGRLVLEAARRVTVHGGKRGCWCGVREGAPRQATPLSARMCKLLMIALCGLCGGEPALQWAVA